MCAMGQVRLPGTDDSPHIIGRSDLLAHNRGKNSELDEWLKDVEEVRFPCSQFVIPVSHALSLSLLMCVYCRKSGRADWRRPKEITSLGEDTDGF